MPSICPRLPRGQFQMAGAQDDRSHDADQRDRSPEDFGQAIRQQGERLHQRCNKRGIEEPAVRVLVDAVPDRRFAIDVIAIGRETGIRGLSGGLKRRIVHLQAVQAGVRGQSGKPSQAEGQKGDDDQPSEHEASRDWA